MEEKLCSYCGLTFVLPDPNFQFLKFGGGNGSQIFLEKRGRVELIHCLKSAKRTALIKKRAEAKAKAKQFQIKKEKTKCP